MSNTRESLSIARKDPGIVDLAAAADVSRAEEIQKRLLAANLATTARAHSTTPIAAMVWRELADEIYSFITVE